MTPQKSLNEYPKRSKMGSKTTPSIPIYPIFVTILTQIWGFTYKFQSLSGTLFSYNLQFLGSLEKMDHSEFPVFSMRAGLILTKTIKTP